MSKKVIAALSLSLVLAACNTTADVTTDDVDVDGDAMMEDDSMMEDDTMMDDDSMMEESSSSSSSSADAMEVDGEVDVEVTE